MTRWLIGLVLGLIALTGVYFLWHQESAKPHGATLRETPAARVPAAVSPAPPGGSGLPAAAQPPGSATETAPAASTASAEGIIVIDEPWARATAANGTTAAYMLMTNTSETADRLVSVSSPDAAQASIHETRIDSKNVVTMRPASRIDLDPGVPVVFEPGGLHVMLEGLKHPLKEGDQLTVIFTFQHAGTLNVKVPVGEQQTDGDSTQP
jgi:periplasmic copper chaperone A